MNGGASETDTRAREWPDVLEEERQHILGVGKQPIALCLSGGGIRSATFGLGVLQALAASKLLTKFHYLSTVSGGGYIGSWLTAWCHRAAAAGGLTTVEDQLGQVEQGKEPLEIAHLRRYSNYLAPRAGLLSADWWSLGTTYLRNLVLNWVLLLPLLFLVLLFPRVLLRLYTKPGVGPGSFWFAVAIGFICAWYIVWFIARQRPVPRGRNNAAGVGHHVTGGRLHDLDFVVRFILPLLVAEIAFSLVWYWGQFPKDGMPVLRRDPGHPKLLCWLLISTAVCGMSSWAIGSLVHPRLRTLRLLGELVLVVLTAMFGAWLSYLAATHWMQDPRENILLYILTVIPIGLAFFLITSTLLLAGWSKWGQTELEREWFARAGGWCLIAAVTWVSLCGIVFYGPALFLALAQWGRYSRYVVSSGGLLATLIEIGRAHV